MDTKNQDVRALLPAQTADDDQTLPRSIPPCTVALGLVSSDLNRLGIAVPGLELIECV